MPPPPLPLSPPPPTSHSPDPGRPDPAATTPAAAATVVRATAATAPPGTAPLRWRSEDLLQQQAQVEIAHGGQVYRLRVTAQGKLILTK